MQLKCINLSCIFLYLLKNNLMFKHLYFALLLFSTTCNTVVGQSKQKEEGFSWHERESVAYFKSYMYNAVDAATTYRIWEPSDWLLFSGITISTATIHRYDSDINSFFKRNQHSSLDGVSQYFFDPVGGEKLFGLLILYTTGSYLTHNIKAQETGLNAIKSGMIATAAFMTMKNTFQRPRPYVNDGYPLFTEPFHRDFQSFPSGHAAGAFAVATVFSEAYKDTYHFLPYICYGLAGLISLSRVYDNEHYLSDVMVGASLGYIIGRTVSKKHYWHRNK